MKRLKKKKKNTGTGRGKTKQNKPTKNKIDEGSPNSLGGGDPLVITCLLSVGRDTKGLRMDLLDLVRV